MSTIPEPIFGPNGFQVPEDAAILQACLDDVDAALGGGFNMDQATPQGQLATLLAASVSSADATFLYFSRQVDPQFAQGFMQDAIGRIYFQTRRPAVGTQVTCTCGGLAGAVIAAGAKAKDTSGNLYTCAAGGVIGAGGTVNLVFVNDVPGPTPCASGTLTQIYQASLGWDTITNPSDGIPGALAESQQAFEARRAATVAGNSVNTVQAVYAAVVDSGLDLNPPEPPADVFVTANYTASPATVKGVSIPANSIYVCVEGGDPQSIADAIWSKLPPGIPMTGGTTVTVEDDNYTPPITYSIKFQTASNLTIYFAVDLVADPRLPADIIPMVQAAIVSAFAGGDGGAPAHIGTDVFASRFFAAVIATSPFVQVRSLFVGTTPSPSSGASVTVDADQYPVTALADIAVVLT